jgi:hypothetical protein
MYAHDISLPFRDLNRFNESLKKNILRIREKYYDEQLIEIEKREKLKNEAFQNHLIGFKHGYEEAEKKYTVSKILWFSLFSYLLNSS